MDAVWSAATIKVIGSGIHESDFADKPSRLIGDHDAETTSTSHSESGKSTSISIRQERILPADAIRALAKGTALCFATGRRAAMLDLRPWYLGPGGGAVRGLHPRLQGHHRPRHRQDRPEAERLRPCRLCPARQRRGAR
jgi:hypothetical protein